MAGSHDRPFADTLRLYEALLATIPDVERKGATNPYTSLNGNMFSHLSPAGVLTIRLPARERLEFMERYGTAPVEAYGVVLKEYVAVPDDLLARTHELAPYLALSYDYAKTLRPKATTRKKAPSRT